MSIGKASDFKLQESALGFGAAKRPLASSYITLSDDTIADDASIGDVLGTLSITAAYVGTPRWEIVGHSNYAVNATTGVVTVAHALTAGAESFKVKLRGTTPQINSPTFSFTVDTGGGGGGYVAKAVHFDGTAWLRNGSLVATNGTSFSLSLWFKGTTSDDTGGKTFYVTDPEDKYTTSVGLSIYTPTNYIAGGLWDDAGHSVTAFTAPGTTLFDGQWHHLLISGTTGEAFGSNAFKYFIDDVDVTWGLAESPSVPFTMNFNGVPAWFGTDYDGADAINMDIAEVWIAPNVSLLTAGTIPEANRRLFISADKKPVNPSGFPASATLFSGDHTTFATNQGTGGAFTLTGTLTNATTSPSD